MSPTTLVFDLGGVLIDWDPRRAYRQLGGTEAEIDHFLEHVATSEWNHQFDAGRPFVEGIAERKQLFPEHAEWLDAWWSKWPDMLVGSIQETVNLLAEVRQLDIPLYALTNWSAETFPIARERFEFLSWFDGIVVSGEVELAKPDPAIFHRLISDFSIVPAESVFIDDTLPNVEIARQLGFTAIHFTTPAALRTKLTDLGVLASSNPGAL
ncbi:MAG: HAD-IA family hydrolase [Rubricoccaceae bacterium]